LAEGFKRMAKEMKVWRGTIEAREGALVRAGRDARAGSSAKGEFLATMSHEIRTPMNAILGFNHLLLDTKLDVRQRSFAETVAASGESLLKILNDVLDFSKIEAGKLTLETLEFDPRDVIETSLDLLAVAARSKGIEIASRIDGTVPAWLRGDPGRLRQVLVNLIGNGVKFTTKGEVLVEARARGDSTAEDGRQLLVLEFSVRDTGAGMSPDLASRLFEPFMQADSSTTRKHGGTGLGLAISKRIVEMMGGSISVESRPGEGSVFTFSAAFERSTQTATPDARPLSLPAGARVLVADDNAAVRELLSREIKDLGLLPAGEPGGVEALRALRSEAEAGRPYALAILDASMLGMDGVAVASAIKEDPKLSGVRTVLLRTLGDRITDEKLAQAGISAFVMKPVKRRSLVDAIATALAVEGGERTEGGAGPARARDPASGSSRSLSAKLTPPERRLRILLAEDSLVNQRLALLFLEKLGYQASVVTNGAKAVEATATGGFDLVLMDCQMPEMDGYEASRAIRNRELKEGAAAHRTTIIALTANAMADDRRRCLDSGMDDYLRKPIRISELRETLARCEDILK
ncbi:MAG TPA: response regulator, partial [Planctomycetota bacterium]|nr:response regulator [Planctomycetota bacterium]